MTLVCNPWNSERRTTKNYMCSQHILKKSTYFSTCIHPFKVFAACLPSPAAAILSYSTSLSTCAKGLWHCGHYSFLSHIQWSARGRIAGEITTDGEHISKHVSECPVFFSPEGAPIPTPCFVMNPGSTTHIQSNQMCLRLLLSSNRPIRHGNQGTQ